MKKLRNWLRRELLPVWVKEDLLRENERLRKRIKQLEEELRIQTAYCAGIHAGTRVAHRGCRLLRQNREEQEK